MAYETITHIDDSVVADRDDFTEVMKDYSSGEVANFTVISSQDNDAETRVIEITFTDRWQYHMDQCQQTTGCDMEETRVLMETLKIEQGDAFLGVSNLRSNTAAVDGWGFLADDDLSGLQKGLVLLVAPLILLGVPIQNDGHTMPLEERAMLIAGDGIIASNIGTEGMLATFDFLFWLAWINFLLGFANLIPMIPFDGGHIFRDAAHSTMRFIMRGGDPIRIENAANRLSSMSSLCLLYTSPSPRD